MWLRGLCVLLFALHVSFGVELATPPSITFTSTNAMVRWVTDVATGTRVRVEPGEATVTVTQGETPDTQHIVVISGLRAATHYTVVVGTARLWLATNSFTMSGPATDGVGRAESGVVHTNAANLHKAPPSRETWGNPASLADHFERHGKDFHAQDPEDYARQAWEFLQRAKAEGLPAKLDADHVLRVFDPRTGAFGAYNKNGTTRTYFKPGSRSYFDRQPGKTVNLKNWK